MAPSRNRSFLFGVFYNKGLAYEEESLNDNNAV